MNRKKESTSPHKEGSSSNVAIIVAVIGLLGTIITAFLTYLVNTRPTDTEIAIFATQTAEAKLTMQAQTSIALTPSLITPSNTTSGEGLQFNLLSKDCVNSALWFSLDNEQDDKCLPLDKYGIYADDGRLTFLFINSSSEKIRHGIFTPIEKGTQIRFNLSISDLYTPVNDDLANLSLGIISRNSFNLENDTLLIYQRESPQKGYPIFMKKGERGGFESYLSQNGEYIEYAKNTSQEIFLDISDMNQLTVYVDGLPVIQVSVPFQDKVFWIGYRLSGNCQINAEISELQIQKK